MFFNDEQEMKDQNDQEDVDNSEEEEGSNKVGKIKKPLCTVM